MKAWMTAAGLAAVLGACGSDSEVSLTNATAQDVATAVERSGAGGDTFRPGQWTSRVKLISAEAPGLPPQALDAMRQAFAKTGPQLSCLSAEEAAKPAADFFTGNEMRGCRFENFSMGGGRIDSLLVCSSPEEGMSQRLAMRGTYSADTYDMTMTGRTDMPGLAAGGSKAPAMTMTMQVSARHTGDCTGREAVAPAA